MITPHLPKRDASRSPAASGGHDGGRGYMSKTAWRECIRSIIGPTQYSVLIY